MKRSLYAVYTGVALVATPGMLAFQVSLFPAGRSAFASSSNGRDSVQPAAFVAARVRGLAPSLSPHKIVNSYYGWSRPVFVPGLPARRHVSAAGALGSSIGDGSVENDGDTAARFPPRPSPPLQNIPHTSLVLRDDATGCDVYLVGCLHGSYASGQDVLDVLEKVRPGAVVLELCQTRHRALRKDLEKTAKEGEPLEGKERWISILRSWGKGVRKTSKKAGLLQGLLAGLLSAPYLVQRFGNFDPGLEFKTAMMYADASVRPKPAGAVIDQASSTPPPEGTPGGGKAAAAQWAGVPVPGEECVIVLGDRDVQETLKRLGGGMTALTDRQERGTKEPPSGNRIEATGAAGGFTTAGWSESVLASDVRVVMTSVLGPSGMEWPDSLNVFDTVWRERQTLGSILFPLLLILVLATEAFQRSIGGAASVIAAAGGSGGALGGIEIFGEAADSSVFEGVGAVVETASGLRRALEGGAGDAIEALFVVWSFWFMLRFFRLVIKERDDVLAENVMKACREHPGRPVVAVLGLLHCNGVADLLRNSFGLTGGGAARVGGGEE